ncbi:MAG TPA: thiol peroxidase [Ilumatobacter sp.]|jgi:thioredoxin-dependent peroxiredoxin|nr:thiol peroxidase [Ilumatobacter sp.]
MATVNLRGNPIHTSGELPEVGSQAPDFTVTGGDLSDVTLDQFAGKQLILNIYPSVDTPTCAASTRAFNERAGGRDDAAVLCVSQDLPFAFGRFCGAEGIENVKTGSVFRSSFLDDYGVKIVDGPLRGLAARAVVIVDGDGKVKYTQLVPEIGQEPDYDAALAALD